MFESYKFMDMCSARIHQGAQGAYKEKHFLRQAVKFF